MKAFFTCFLAFACVFVAKSQTNIQFSDLQIPRTAGYYTQYVGVGDLNNDGIYDILTSEGSYLTPNGTAFSTTPLGISTSESVIVADVDSDNDLD